MSMRCLYCGNEIRVGREYCDVCGMPREMSMPEQPENGKDGLPPETELPPLVRYDSWGRIAWNYSFYNRKREKMEVRYKFDEDYLICYPPVAVGKKEKKSGSSKGRSGIGPVAAFLRKDLGKSENPESDRGDEKEYYYYDKITQIMPNLEKEEIVLIFGEEKAQISVSQAQYEFILNQLIRQCPNAEVV